MTLRLLDITAAGYRRHPLHEQVRTWSETNCYVDVWIELLHSLGLDPLAAAAFALSSDFEGDQWTFFKYPPEDLRAVYGIEVAEMNVWLPIEQHVVDQLGMGRLLTVEVDAWYLPDTTDSYRTEHVKTTIVPQAIDLETRELGYFHNAGYYELAGDDFDGVFRLGEEAASLAASGVSMPPYVELVQLDRMQRDDADVLVTRAVALAREHLGRRPTTNPVARFRERLKADLEWLAGHDLETFHLWAFGTCRQWGASAELAASFLEWLGVQRGDDALAAPAADFAAIAESAKSLQFMLARAVRGRSVDTAPVLDQLERRWDAAMAGLSVLDGT
jgi:Domain of unknown function (DUF1839)